MRSNVSKLAVVLLAVCLCAGAYAKSICLQKKIEVAASGTTKTETVTIQNARINDITVWVPTLDAGDTATIGLREVLTTDDSGTTAACTPAGWSDITVGATEDNAFKTCRNGSSALDIWVDGTVQLIVTTSTAQEAARECRAHIDISQPE